PLASVARNRRFQAAHFAGKYEHITLRFQPRSRRRLLLRRRGGFVGRGLLVSRGLVSRSLVGRLLGGLLVRGRLVGSRLVGSRLVGSRLVGGRLVGRGFVGGGRSGRRGLRFPCRRRRRGLLVILLLAATGRAQAKSGAQTEADEQREHLSHLNTT